MKLRYFCVCIVLLCSAGLASAQDFPRCSERPGFRFDPRVDPLRWCFEEVIHEANAGEMPFTALVTVPDGTLYATRPLYGQLIELTDADGDGLPESSRIAAEGLTLPNALAYHDGAVYIAGGAHLYRYRDGAITTLVDDLPSGTGVWTGGIAIHDEQIYVGIGASCAACSGGIWRYDLDGSNRSVIAEGVRAPHALAFHEGVLYAGDVAPPGTAERGLDEINRVMPGDHLGYPDCPTNCVPPFIRLDTDSQPVALLSYQHDLYPFIQGKLLLVMAGSHNRADQRGYEVVAIDLNAEPILIETLLPYDKEVAYTGVFTYDGSTYYRNDAPQILNARGAGFLPHHLYGIATSPEGWLYLSAGGGRIVALRPQT